MPGVKKGKITQTKCIIKTRDEITEKLGGSSDNKGTETIILQSYSNLRGLYMAESKAPKRIFLLFFFLVKIRKKK